MTFSTFYNRKTTWSQYLITNLDQFVNFTRVDQFINWTHLKESVNLIVNLTHLDQFVIFTYLDQFVNMTHFNRFFQFHSFNGKVRLLTVNVRLITVK